jgi:hypothetical protein
MYGKIKDHLIKELAQIRDSGLFKDERVLAGRQGAKVELADGRQVINLCANNYLGLAGTQELVEASKAGLEKWGYGLSSVRFICGTQQLHKQLEQKVSEFLGTEDTILYSILPVLMPMPGFLKPCWAARMRSSPMSSITPASSTAFGYAKPNDIVTKTTR